MSSNYRAGSCFVRLGGKSKDKDVIKSRTERCITIAIIVVSAVEDVKTGYEECHLFDAFGLGLKLVKTLWVREEVTLILESVKGAAKCVKLSEYHPEVRPAHLLRLGTWGEFRSAVAGDERTFAPSRLVDIIMAI